MAKVDNLATTPDRRLAGNSGSLNAVAFGDWVTMPRGPFNFVLAGAFVATAILECSLDGGDTVVPVCDESGQPAQYSSPGCRTADCNEPDTLVRCRVTQFTSGAVAWRISC